jgi:hypothetical protein
VLTNAANPSTTTTPKRSSPSLLLAARIGLVALAVLFALVGCKTEPVKQGASEMSIPADFALQLRVHGKAGAKDVAQQSVDYVVESNRALRVAGASWGAQGRVFPPLLRYLDYKEFDSLYRLIQTANLAAEPTSPNGELAAKGKPIADAWYEVTITFGGRTHAYATTGAESPPTSQLLVRLHELRSGHRLGASPGAAPATAPANPPKK